MAWWTFNAETLSSNATWAWNWAQAPAISLATYTANTLVFGLNQVVALRDSLPALAAPETKKIIDATCYITYNKILPLVILNYANTLIQNEAIDAHFSLRYAAMLIDWAVLACTYHYGIELLLETAAINAYAPAAFNTYKATLPRLFASPCEGPPPCNFKRRAKGSLREFFLLYANDVLTGAVSYIPYIGQPTALVLSIYFSGDLIVRSSLLDRCERHRTSGSSEVLLAVGSTYTLANRLLDSVLEKRLSIPTSQIFPLSLLYPILLVHKALRHLMFLAFVNNTVHIPIKYIEPGKGTCSFDPIVIYQRINSNIIDIAFAGLMDGLTKIFHPAPNAEPLFSLSDVFKKLTKVLNNDLEKARDPNPGFFKKNLIKAVPRILRSTKDAVHDPVIRIFWKELQELLLGIMDTIEDAAKPVGKLMKVPVPGMARMIKAALPELLFQKYGLSRNLTKFLINLSKDDDFWNFFLTLKQWLEHHHVGGKKALAVLDPDTLSTLDESTTETLKKPSADQIAEIPPPAQLNPSLKQDIVAVIIPTQIGHKPANTTTLDPGFFAQRQRRKAEQTSNAVGIGLLIGQPL